MATETYGLPPVVSSSHTCGCESPCQFLWVHPTMCADFECIPVFCMCVQTKQDAMYHLQIYNSGTERGLNTLVSVADEGDEQRRGVM